MSTLKTDAVTAISTNGDLSLDGLGSGVPDIGAGFKVDGTVGVPTASIQDDAVTLAKMASGTDGVILTYDASGNPVHVGPGTDGQLLTSTGAGSPPAFEDAAGGGFTLGTEQTASGSSITFSGIPSGVTFIILSFFAVSKAAGGSMEVQLGDAGGIETTGYVSVGLALKAGPMIERQSSTTSFNVPKFDPGGDYSGQMFLSLKDAATFEWSSSSNIAFTTTSVMISGGSKGLSAELTQLKIIATSTTFNGGTFNIMYQ